MKNSFSIGLLFFLFVALNTVSASDNRFKIRIIKPTNQNNIISTDSAHNCRFWGMVAAGTYDGTSILEHLNGLKQLAPSNPNGWGIGFYTSTVRGGHIPVVYKGMWRADQDNFYDSSARLMIDNLSTCGIAHIRNSSSGYVNIPNPHPFLTQSIDRDFSTLFAHNGTLNKSIFITLLGTYTSKNHYAYAGTTTVNDPNHDSDLYRLYLMKWVDEHPGTEITQCLKDALNSLTAQMGYGLSYNFVMGSTSNTLWALRYNNTLSYRRATGSLGYVWEVASEPLGGTNWVSASNHYLYVFKTNQALPDSILLNDQTVGIRTEVLNNSIPVSMNFASPTVGNILNIQIEVIDNQSISIEVFNNDGQFISNKTDILVRSGKNNFEYNLNNLKAGIYIVKLKAGKNIITRKLVVSN